MMRWRKIAIIAGGGDLPVRLAESCRRDNLSFLVVKLDGFADAALDRFQPVRCGLGEVGRLLRLMKTSECDAVVMAGTVPRPNFSRLKPDWRGVALLPKVVKAARRGDGALLAILVQTFETEGFAVIGAEEVLADLYAPQGAIGAVQPTEQDFRDMQKAAAIISALGPYDVGQGAVVRNGFVLAIEAAEGTDRMLERVRWLPASAKGFEPGETEAPRGVLLKRPKPGQEMRVDLPTIGVETVVNLSRAGLRGIAVEAQAALIVDIEEVAALADREQVFVYGYNRDEIGLEVP